MTWYTHLFPLFGLGMLTACSTTDVAQYAHEKPALDLQQYFNGTVDAWGMFQDRCGKVVKRFKVVIQCSWKDDTGTLDEDFTYSDGTKQKRVWTLRKNARTDNTSAPRPMWSVKPIGITAGNALRWKYVLALPVGDKVYNVNFEDWMFLMDDKVMLNRAEMSKFGFRLGEVTLSFSKRP